MELYLSVKKKNGIKFAPSVLFCKFLFQLLPKREIQPW